MKLLNQNKKCILRRLMHVSHSLHILCARACVWFRLNQTKSFSVNKFVFEVEQSSSINGIVTHFFFRHTIGKPHLPLTFIACLFCMLHLLPVYFLCMSSVALPMKIKYRIARLHILSFSNKTTNCQRENENI